MTGKQKNLYIVAGPNGSGKTTFVHKLLPEYTGCIYFVNADLIAAGLSPFSPDTAAIKAGKIMLEQIQEHIKAGHDFAFETTLAGKTYVRLLNDLKKKNYKIHLFYLWLHDVDLAINEDSRTSQNRRAQCAVRRGAAQIQPGVIKSFPCLQTSARFIDIIR